MPLPLGVVGAALALLGGGSAAGYGLARFRPENAAVLYGYNIEKTVGQYANRGGGDVYRALYIEDEASEARQLMNLSMSEYEECRASQIPDTYEPSPKIGNIPDINCRKTALEAGKEYWSNRYKSLQAYAKYFFGVSDLEKAVDGWRRFEGSYIDTTDIRNRPLVISGGFLFFKEAGATFDSENMEHAQALYKKEARHAFIDIYDSTTSQLSKYDSALAELENERKALEAKAKPVVEDKKEPKTEPKEENRPETKSRPAVKPKVDTVARPKPSKKECKPQDMGKPGCPISID